MAIAYLLGEKTTNDILSDRKNESRDLSRIFIRKK